MCIGNSIWISSFPPILLSSPYLPLSLSFPPTSSLLHPNELYIDWAWWNQLHYLEQISHQFNEANKILSGITKGVQGVSLTLELKIQRFSGWLREGCRAAKLSCVPNWIMTSAVFDVALAIIQLGTLEWFATLHIPSTNLKTSVGFPVILSHCLLPLAPGKWNRIYR